MPIHKLHSSFNAGELSPLMDSRVNVEKYEAGCRKLRNFILHTHGPVFRRPGFVFLGAQASHDTASRFMEFNFSATTTFMIEAAAGGVFRFWSNGGLVLKDSGAVLEVAHPYQESELFEVQVKQVNDVCYLSHRNHHPLKLIRVADNDWTCDTMPLRYPPLLDEYVEKESVATPTVTEIYDASLQEAPEQAFTQRTPGAVGTYEVNTRAGTLASPLQWFTVSWTWPSTPATTGAPTRTLALEVFRPRDSTWQVIGSAVTLSTTSTPPSGYQFQFRANGTTGLLVDRKTGAAAWANLTTLASFFATATAVGTVPDLTFRWVYGPATTNDLAGHAVIATDWESNVTTTAFVHVLTTVASKDITATWKLPATVPASRTLAWQVLNSSNNWVSLYSWAIALTLDDAAVVWRLRYTAATTLALEEKHANGYWTQRGTVTINAGTSWTLRWLYGPETAQGISVSTAVACVTTNTSTTVTMGSTTGRTVGEHVTGAGIPVGATIASITNGTDLVISAAATASASVTLNFIRDARVTLADGAVTHTAICERAESGVGADFGKGGMTVPAGKWQTRIETDVQTVPTGATTYLQKWTGAAWSTITSWVIGSGGTYEYNGLLAGAFTVDTMVRFLYKGGTSLRKTLGNGVIETVVYPDSKAITIEVSDTIGPGRTMLAKDADSDPVDLFQAGHVGAYWQIAHRRELSFAELVGVVGAFSTLISSEIRVSGRWDIFTYGTWTGTLYLERKTPSNVWQVIRTWSSRADRNVTASGSEEQDVDLRLRVSSGTSGAAASGAAVPRFVLEAADSRTYGLVKVTAFVSASEVEVEVVRILAATTPTTLWAEGAWSDVRGYPNAVGLHEARLWFGGSRYQPQTLWASVSNDFENFRRSTLDDGALVATLAAESSNSIRWLSSTTALLIGTGGEEWALRSATEGAPITPTSIRVERQSGYSSMQLGAKMAHEVTVFVQRDGRRVRQLSYTDTQQSFTAADLTVLAPHVTEGGVRQIAFQQAPTAILWVVTNDGKLVGMTFEREQNVFGWHVHDTDGEIETVAVLHGTPADEVWVGVKRTIEGVTKRYVERMQPQAMAGDWDEPRTLVYLDSAKVYEFDVAQALLEDLEHLEGKTVAILADGMVHRSMVVTGGEVTMDATASKVVVGLPFTSELQPMKQEVQLQDGTAQGRRFKLHGVTVRVDHSLGGDVNANPLDNTLPWSRMPNMIVMGEAAPLFTGERDIILESRHEAAVNLTVRQTEPLPMNITALILKFDTYGQ